MDFLVNIIILPMLSHLQLLYDYFKLLLGILTYFTLGYFQLL
jgi:hypothetical protein